MKQDSLQGWLIDPPEKKDGGDDELMIDNPENEIDDDWKDDEFNENKASIDDDESFAEDEENFDEADEMEPDDES